MIAVYGAGYVGLVSAVCLAKLGRRIICVDVDEKKIAQLNQGKCPIHEEGLPELLQEQLAAGRLIFTTDNAKAANNTVMYLIAAGTPSFADGSADLTQVKTAAAIIAQHAKNDFIIVTKSTVPVGTGDELENLVKHTITDKKIKFAVASNPEFLREGSAVYDFLQADRIVIGGNDYALNVLKQMYQPLTAQGIPLLEMSRRSAELTKYAANAMLACKISFINQISRLAEAYDANIEDIAAGMALDERIGPHFLQAGIGYGGSCFPKDVRAIVQTAKAANLPVPLLAAIDEVNLLQKEWVLQQMTKHFKQSLRGLTIGIWGLAFKPGTDDLREASSLTVIQSLLKEGVHVIAYDPAALQCAQQLLAPSEKITWCTDAEQVLDHALDGLVIATEWPVFKEYPLKRLKQKLGKAAVFDGRNCYHLSAVKEAELAAYYSVGRPAVVSNQLQKEA